MKKTISCLSLLKSGVINTLPPAAVLPPALYSSRCVHFLPFPKHHSSKSFVYQTYLRILENRCTHTYTMETWKLSIRLTLYQSVYSARQKSHEVFQQKKFSIGNWLKKSLEVDNWTYKQTMSQPFDSRTLSHNLCSNQPWPMAASFPYFWKHIPNKYGP
jgi:hypothetical protein